jgi:hypothetical protein
MGPGQFVFVEEWEDYDDGKRPHQDPDGTWVVPAKGSRSVGRFKWVPGLMAQNPAPTGSPSQKLPGCIFEIGITTNGLLDSGQLEAMRDEISRIFATAGQEINFVSTNANYYLNANAVGANYTNNPDAIGLTPLDGSAVTNVGRVFVDRLTTSATNDDGSSRAFNQNSKALAIGLGRAGSHEIGHYLLQQNYDSSAITGVMHNSFKGSEWFGKTSEGLWKFSPAQIKQLNSLCGR